MTHLEHRLHAGSAFSNRAFTAEHAQQLNVGRSLEKGTGALSRNHFARVAGKA